MRVGRDHGLGGVGQAGDLGVEGFEHGALGVEHGGRLLVFSELAQGGCGFDEQGAGTDQPVEGVVFGGMGVVAGGAKGLAEPGDHLGVDGIVFGEAAGRSGEVAHPPGIDDAHRDAGGAQGLGPILFVAAAGFHDGERDLVLVQPGDHLALSVRRGRLRQAQAGRADAGVGFVFGDVDADNPFCLWPVRLCHAPTPFLARPGSQPKQLFGLKEAPDLSLALPQGCASGGHGIRSSDRRLWHSRLSLYYHQSFGHKGGSTR